ncbi:probable beta-1,4-mannosyl-glycoprotein 4-beta-N-acetylglucosaminyltransferase [Coccomyxa sp. Obi]|nr:probable beta-1,4-mannosyl-glycoprotein 4-beta-N-acetylglucosaminyltransferase [Coccomyxa sp. Obi]
MARRSTSLNTASAIFLLSAFIICSKAKGEVGDPKPTYEDFCQQHGLPEREDTVRIFDSFMFNTELDMLEVRLTELYDVVDFFVIGESRRTMQDRPKPLYYAENAARFERFADKILHVPLDTDAEDKVANRLWLQKVKKQNGTHIDLKMKRYGPLDEPFYREWWQREQLFERGLGEARRGDLFVLGDVDEIPRPAALRALRRCRFEAAHNCAAMESDMFYYSYSLYSGVWKAGPKVVPYLGEDTLGGMDQDAARWESECSLSLPRAATHCSSCFGAIEDFQNKMASFAHWQLNIAAFTDPAMIVGRVTKGISLLGKESDLTVVPYCDHAPQAVLDNPGRFHYLLARDPDTGSFSDYEQQFFGGKQGKKKPGKVTE